ncbi:MAG: hypothetical protein D6693_07575 [Planctomycetota bacterium]|nr:MAG: hypothetical protein D6693_07575 [Planctomycetota bacterium]
MSSSSRPRSKSSSSSSSSSSRKSSSSSRKSSSSSSKRSSSSTSSSSSSKRKGTAHGADSFSDASAQASRVSSSGVRIRVIGAPRRSQQQVGPARLALPRARHPAGRRVCPATPPGSRAVHYNPRWVCQRP